MFSVRCLLRSCRAWVLPLVLFPFLGATLLSCASFQCEAVTPPSVIPTLFMVDGRLYLFSQGTNTLYTIRASDGQELWHVQGTFEAVESDDIYLSLIQQDTAFLDARQASDGKLLWHRKQAAVFHVLGTAAGSVYLYEYAGNKLVALNATDGSQRWNTALSSPLPVDGYDTRRLSLQVSAGVVFLRSDAGSLSAYQEESGALLWNHLFSGPLEEGFPWFVGQGMIYLSADHLYALRASDGAVLWQGNQASITLDAEQGILYALAFPHLSALRAQDGQALWTRDASALQGPLALKLVDGTLYAGGLYRADRPAGGAVSDFMTAVFALRASDGQSLWQQAGYALAVAGAGGTAYLLSYNPAPQQSINAATLTAQRVSDGQSLWQQNITPAAGMIFADDALYSAYGGDNQTSGCYASGLIIAAKFSPADGRRLWRFQAPAGT